MRCDALRIAVMSIGASVALVAPVVGQQRSQEATRAVDPRFCELFVKIGAASRGSFKDLAGVEWTDSDGTKTKGMFVSTFHLPDAKECVAIPENPADPDAPLLPIYSCFWEARATAVADLEVLYAGVRGCFASEAAFSTEPCEDGCKSKVISTMSFGGSHRAGPSRFNFWVTAAGAVFVEVTGKVKP